MQWEEVVPKEWSEMLKENGMNAEKNKIHRKWMASTMMARVAQCLSQVTYLDNDWDLNSDYLI